MLKEMLETFEAAGIGANTETFGGDFNISVLITAGTVNLERSFDNQQSWWVVDTFTASVEDAMADPEGSIYRFNCTTFTTGPIKCRLGQ